MRSVTIYGTIFLRVEKLFSINLIFLVTSSDALLKSVSLCIWTCASVVCLSSLVLISAVVSIISTLHCVVTYMSEDLLFIYSCSL